MSKAGMPQNRHIKPNLWPGRWKEAADESFLVERFARYEVRVCIRAVTPCRPIRPEKARL
jgi:hypothetical protein